MPSIVQEKKDRIILVILALHLAAIIIYSSLTNHFHVIVPAVIAFSTAGIIFRLKPGTFLSRCIIALSLIGYSAILIHLSHGLIEMHFHVFAALALLSIYYDWRVVVLAGVAISIHHLVGLVIPIYDVYQPDADLFIYSLHVLFVGLTSAVLGYQCYVISRSVNTINQSSQVLVEHDLPQLLQYLQKISNGELNGTIEFKAKTVPVVASDELGSLSRLYNQLVLSYHSIGHTSYLIGQGLHSMIQRSQENVEHIRKLTSRMARSVEHSNNYIGQEIGFASDTTIPEYRIKEQIELVSAKMVMAALQLDELQYKLEARMTEQIQLNEQLKEINQLKGRFFASLSHELRTPLTAILAYSELLLLDLQDQNAEASEQSARQIAESAVNMRQLLNDILDFSKMEAGKFRVSLERTTVARSFAEAIEEIRPLAENKNIRISQRLEGEPTVLADGRRLHQVLLNLLSNAIKFTPPGGQIELRAKALWQVSAEKWLQADNKPWFCPVTYPAVSLAPGKWIAIEVADTGIGIAPEQLPTIFEEFEQIESNLQHGITGTGLGLAIVKKLVALMDGLAVVRSEKGHGTVFTIWLPAWEEADQIAISDSNNLLEYV